jgi:predicted RNA binding protein with dsRBD fold (UPF0201 family)
MLRVRVTTPLRPSEDPQRVQRAVQTILPDARIEMETARVVGDGDSLDGFRKLVWKQRILDAARRILLSSLTEDGRHASFSLNKQAAYAGLVSFSVGEAPLGDVRVEVEGDHLESLFKEIAPPTLRGRPVSEEEYEEHLEYQRRLKGRAKQPGPELAPMEGAKEEE